MRSQRGEPQLSEGMLQRVGPSGDSHEAEGGVGGRAEARLRSGWRRASDRGASRTEASAEFPVQEVRAQFPGASRCCYLNSAAESLFLNSHRDALARYAECKEEGSLGRERCAAVERRCRDLVAELISVDGEDVAFLASTARALDVVVKSIRWQPGANLVIAASEFPTSAFTAAHLAESGVEVRVVPSRRGELALEDFERLIDSRTGLVIVSLVSYETGFLIDHEKLAEIAHAKGAFVFVDAIQGCGALPVNAGDVDFMAAGTYKWQLGAHGLAFLYVRPSIQGLLQQPYVAFRGVVEVFPPQRFERYELFKNARRFEEGMPNYGAMFVLENGLSYLMKLGIDLTARHRARLVSRTMDGLLALGITPLTTTNAAARGSIVSFEAVEPSELVESLARRNVHVWGRDGRLRISPSLYNTLEDIDEFLDVIGPLMRSLRSVRVDQYTRDSD